MVQIHLWHKGYLQWFRNRITGIHRSVQFLSWFYQIHPRVLDLITYRSNNRIKSALHVKFTDTHSYLDYESCHPQSTKRSIPSSQFLRIKQLIRDYWCLQTPVSMYVMSQHHVDILTIIAIHCDSLYTNCWFLKTGLVDHIGVLQTPMRSTTCTINYILKTS